MATAAMGMLGGAGGGGGLSTSASSSATGGTSSGGTTGAVNYGTKSGINPTVLIIAGVAVFLVWMLMGKRRK